MDAKIVLRIRNMSLSPHERLANLTYADLKYADLTGANLTYANLTYADLTYANLKDANLTYADLKYADLKYADLKYADLTYADLTGANLTYANLTYANLTYVDLTYADLKYADLKYADLTYANLSRAKLTESSILRSDIPIIPDIHSALASAATSNTLRMNEWHTCGTVHCRAGWIIVLSGEKGRDLEQKIGTNAAAALIYYASDPALARVPDWYASDEDAIADIERMAEKTNSIES